MLMLPNLLMCLITFISKSTRFEHRIPVFPIFRFRNFTFDSSSSISNTKAAMELLLCAVPMDVLQSCLAPFLVFSEFVKLDTACANRSISSKLGPFLRTIDVYKQFPVLKPCAIFWMVKWNFILEKLVFHPNVIDEDILSMRNLFLMSSILEIRFDLTPIVGGFLGDTKH